MSSLLDQVRGLRAVLVEHADRDGQDRDADAARVDLIAALEQLKSAACAAQADLAVGLDASVRAQHAAGGEPARRRGRGAAEQVALARRVSPHRGQVLLGLAKDLHRDLPHTLAALRTGHLDEQRATVVARETGCLDSDDRRQVEATVCGDTDLLDQLGPRALASEIHRHSYALDPASVVRRHERATSERCVTVRPAPEGMAYLTALLPMVQAVSCWAGLKQSADGLRATGDPRGRGQAMADLLVERLTGQSAAADVPVTVDLVISDASLLGADTAPATIPGWGPVPAQVAREAIARATESLQAWIRRLYADPAGSLVAMSTRQRLATDGLTDYLTLRDQGICRTPWCDAPIRHADHVIPWASGGGTDAGQLQGLCEQCDHAKQAPGWRQRVIDQPGRHLVETTTPTGHRHLSRAPAPPGHRRRTATTSPAEVGFTTFLHDYDAA